MTSSKWLWKGALLCALVFFAGCEDKGGDAKGGETGEPTGETGTTGTTGEAKAEIKAGPGVDLEKKVLKIGTLDDLSGPAAAIGKPYAEGKKLLAAVVNAGGSGLLPEGWTVELVSKDHGYNPTNAMKAFKEIKDEVLFIGTSFGTPNTLPLQAHLEEAKMVAFPASLSSKMSEHRSTPPLGTPYKLEAMRAADWAVQSAGGADKVKFGIVYQQDDYGKDGLDGLKAAAGRLGAEIVSEQTVAPGQGDMTPVITGLKDAGATHVLLTTLPSATGPILGKAAQLGYAPIWIGNTPSWVDAFFADAPLPNAVKGTFHWVTGLPFWGEDSPGMKTFLGAFEKHGGENKKKDFYTLVSYAQGLVQLEAFRNALEKGDVTREGYLSALTEIRDFTADGMLQPVDLSVFPYTTNDSSRILKPDLEKGTWTVVADFAAPGGGDEKTEGGEKPAEGEAAE